jgi:hypothetical protein
MCSCGLAAGPSIPLCHGFRSTEAISECELTGTAQFYRLNAAHHPPKKKKKPESTQGCQPPGTHFHIGFYFRSGVIINKMMPPRFPLPLPLPPIQPLDHRKIQQGKGYKLPYKIMKNKAWIV